MGNKRTISRSKIKKIIINKKKCIENGIRAFFIGSKPHSKGVFFWKLRWLKAEIKKGIMRIIRQIERIRIALKAFIIIIEKSSFSIELLEVCNLVL